MVMRVVVAKGYNRALARPLYNCPACFDQKEAHKQASPPADTDRPVAGAAKGTSTERR